MIATLFRLIAITATLTVCTAVALFVYGALEGGPTVGQLFPTDWGKPVSETPRRQTFVVEPGQSAAAIGEELERRGLIRHSLAFRWEIESRDLGTKIEAGQYELSPSMSTSEIVGVLAGGAVAPGTTFTVLEGWRADQVALRAEELKLGQAEAIMRIVRAPRDAGITPPDSASATLEGYLFPDTYRIAAGASADELVRTMVRQFEARFDENLRWRAAERGLTLQQIVVMASIIEREAAVPAERPVISSVYHNRLASGMRLEADPTVQYAVASRDLDQARGYGFWKRELTLLDLDDTSPYNTYRVTGLPPGPICNPGLDSLRAAVAPADTGYLFFVAKGDGSHAFATTHDEHLTNIARYQ